MVCGGVDLCGGVGPPSGLIEGIGQAAGMVMVVASVAVSSDDLPGGVDGGLPRPVDQVDGALFLFPSSSLNKTSKSSGESNV